MSAITQDLSVQDRNKMWKENRDNKIKAQRDNKKESGEEECTFAPKFYTKSYRAKPAAGTMATIGSMSKHVE